MYISKIFSDFNNEVIVSVPYITVPANVTRLMLDAALVTTAGDKLIVWNAKYLAYVTPATRIDSAITDIKAAFDDFYPFMQGIKAQLKNSMSVTLTGDDYSNINIHKDAEKRSHIDAPKFAPGSKVVDNSHLAVKLTTFNTDPDEPVEGKLPTDVRMIGRKLAIVEISATPPAADAYKSIPTVSTATYQLTFDEGQTGKKGWIITWYISPTGEEGPHSDPAWFLIN